MITRVLSILGLSVVLLVSSIVSVHAQRRQYPADVFDNILVLFDVITAYTNEVDVSSEETLRKEREHKKNTQKKG